MIERGTICLAKLNPAKGAEPGKIRPVLVLQTDLLNSVGHTTVIVLPLTTRLVNDAFPLRFRIGKREKLEKDSDILCDQIRAIDRGRIVGEGLTRLSEEELLKVETMLRLILDFEN